MAKWFIDEDIRIKAKNPKANCPIYFFDSNEKEFGFCKHQFYSGDENNASWITLTDLIVEEKYRETNLNKLLWIKLLPYLLEIHGDVTTIHINVGIPYGKENTKKKTDDELWRESRTYFKSLGATMYKDSNFGIMYVNKLQEQLKKFKDN